MGILGFFNNDFSEKKHINNALKHIDIIQKILKEYNISDYWNEILELLKKRLTNRENLNDLCSFISQMNKGLDYYIDDRFINEKNMLYNELEKIEQNYINK